MGVPLPVLILSAVSMLAVGCFLAVRLPMAIRQAGGSVIVKTLVGMMLVGGVCAMLGLGGAIIAALVGAATLAVWLGVAGIVGIGIVALSLLGFATYIILRRAAVKRRKSAQ